MQRTWSGSLSRPTIPSRASSRALAGPQPLQLGEQPGAPRLLAGGGAQHLRHPQGDQLPVQQLHLAAEGLQGGAPHLPPPPPPPGPAAAPSPRSSTAGTSSGRSPLPSPPAPRSTPPCTLFSLSFSACLKSPPSCCPGRNS